MRNLQDLIQTSISFKLPKTYDMTDYAMPDFKYQRICQVLEDNEFNSTVAPDVSVSVRGCWRPRA